MAEGRVCSLRTNETAARLPERPFEFQRSGCLVSARAATGGSAARLGYGDPIGRLTPGARARLIFIANAPLQTVASLRRERVTVFDGRVFVSHGGEQTEGL